MSVLKTFLKRKKEASSRPNTILRYKGPGRLGGLGDSSGTNLGKLTASGGSMDSYFTGSTARGRKAAAGLSVNDLLPKKDPVKSAGLTVTRAGNGGGGGRNLKKGVIKKAIKTAARVAVDPIGAATFGVGKKIFKKKK